MLQASLVLIQASEGVSKKDTKPIELSSKITDLTKARAPSKQAEIPKAKKENVKDAEVKENLDARKGRQLSPYYQGQPNNEVVVDIEDDEKSQYYETNYDTSEYTAFIYSAYETKYDNEPKYACSE